MNHMRDRQVEEPSPRVRRTRRQRLRLLTATVGTLILALSVAAPGQSSDGDKYTGHERGDPGGAKIVFRTIVRHGTAKRAVFEVRDLELFCGDSLESNRQTLGPFRVPFKSRNTFRTEIYSIAPNGDETFYKVVGHLVGKTRARGSFVYDSDIANPVPGGPADCSTFGPAAWKAHRSH